MNASSSRPSRWFWPVVITYVLIAGYYSVRIPLWEAPDEPEHFQYVRWLAVNQSLPGSSLPSIQINGNNQSNQAPLYYTIGALLTSWIDTSSIDQLRPNPRVTWTDDPSRHAYVLHTEDEFFPYHGTVLAAHLLRLLSIAFGAIVVAATYAVGRITAPDQPGLAVGAAAFLAFAPGFLGLTSAVTNDSGLAAFGALAVLELVRTIRFGASNRIAARLALWISLAVLAKESGLILLPIGLLAVTRPGPVRQALQRVGILIAGFVLLAGWWFLHNWLLFGTFIRKEDAGLTRLVTSGHLSLHDTLRGLEGYYHSFIGTFGWGLIPLPTEIYRLGLIVFAPALVGLTLVSVDGVRRPKVRSGPHLWLALTAGSTLAIVELRRQALIGHVWGIDHFRFLAPALPAFAVLFATGLWRFADLARPLQVAKLLPLGFIALALVVPGHYIVPRFPPPLSARSVESAWPIDHRFHATFGNTFELVGLTFDRPAISAGDVLKLSLYWRTLRRPDREYSAFVQVLDDQGRLRAQSDIAPGHLVYPATDWPPGQVVRDQRIIPLPSSLEPGRYRLLVGLYWYLEPSQRLAVTTQDLPVESDAVVVGDFDLLSADPGLARTRDLPALCLECT